MTIPSSFWYALLLLFVSSMVGFCVWMVKTVNALKVDIARAQVQLVPLSAMIQDALLKLLHHDDPAYRESDALIDVALHKPDKMTADEDARLRQLMKQRAVADVSELERKRAVALLAFMDIVVIEKQGTLDKLKTAALTVFVGASLASMHHRW